MKDFLKFIHCTRKFVRIIIDCTNILGTEVFDIAKEIRTLVGY